MTSKVRRPRSGAIAPLQLAVLDRGRPRSKITFLRKVVRATLAFARRETMPVSLLLTNDREIGRLHEQFLADPTPTDVISFEIDGSAEIVLSVTTAKRRAREHGHPLHAEIALYIVHGLLHQCGYDDVHKRDRLRMRRAEQAVLAGLALHVASVDDVS